MIDALPMMFLAVLGLILHFRWVLIDPHMGHLPPTRGALALAVAVPTGLMWLGLGLLTVGQSNAGIFCAVTAFGMIMGPAMSPPTVATAQEIPGAWERWKTNRLAALNGATFKTVLLWGLTLLVGVLGFVTDEAVLSIWIAAGMTVLRLGLTVMTSQDSPTPRPITRIMVFGWIGLALWLVLHLPLLRSLPEVNYPGLVWLVAFWIGAFIAD